MMVLPRVDLPHPDSPTSPTVSPGLMDSVTSSTATRVVAFWAPLRRMW